MNGDFHLDARPLIGKLHEFQPLEIVNVNRTDLELTWDYMVKNYHYLGYDNMIGPRIKYLVLYKGTPIAALSYNRASLTVGVRDSFIGWDSQQKHDLLPHVVNNNRFLILPWVKIKYLASHLLSRTLKTLQIDWPLLYGSTPYLVETFVDREKYKGTCYQAANWLYLGETKGFAKVGKAFVYHGNRKGVYIYLLNKKSIRDIKSAPRHQPLKKVRERVPNMMLHTPDWSPEILEQARITTETVECLGQLLDEYLAQFSECYSRSEQQIHGECYVKGLLSNLDRKSMEPIALRYEGEDAVRGMQNFFKDGVWDDAKMLELYKKRLSSVIAEPFGMINTDGCDNPKKGKNSVGVKNQYCGPMGKSAGCQAGIFIGYSSSKGYGLIERELYMPEEWFDESHAELRQKCGVPEELEFKTKNQIASELINKVIASGNFPAKWIGADGAFGADKVFLDSIPDGYYYFATVPSHTSVWLEMPETFIPERKGAGRMFSRLRASTSPVLVSSIAEDNGIPWHRVILAEGAKGPIVAEVKCLRVIDSRDCTSSRHYPLPNKEVWLYIRRFADGRVKHAICNAPADTPMETLNQVATMRWPIEQCFEECKSYLGMDHCEARSWNSWHRHMLFVFISHLFLQEIRIKFKKNCLS